MTSSYTVNQGIEKPAAGDQSGTWGATVNTNMDIIDRVVSGVGALTLTGSTTTLTTTDGALTDGMYRVLVLGDGGDLGSNNTITISPNDQDKLYLVYNNLTANRSAIFSQGSGDNATVENGETAWIYADGAGSGAAVRVATSSTKLLDQDGDTGIRVEEGGDDDDTIRFDVAGAEDFTMTANTLSVLSGSTLNIDSGATIANSGTATGFGSSTAVDSITAGSTQSQAGATALTGTINRVTVSGTNGDGVKLPTAVAGLTCLIINADSAQTIDVWPATGDKIQGGSSNAVDPTSIAAGTSREFYSIDAAEWLRDIPVGTVLQRVVINTTTGTNSTSTTEAATALTATISMLDAASIVQVTAMGPWAVSRSSSSPTNMQGFLRLWEAAVTTGTQLAEERIGYVYGEASQPPYAIAGGALAAKVLNTPGDKAATTFVLGILNAVGSTVLAQFNAGSLQATMLLEEIAT